MCPIGALAFFLHYLHDVVRIEEKYEVDYTLNKSWRAVRVLKLHLTIFNVSNVLKDQAPPWLVSLGAV
jgi:hypothetical protein